MVNDCCGSTVAMPVSIAEVSRDDVDTLQAVARLRYQIYVDEMRREMAHADHARRVVMDRLDGCSLILVARDPTGAIVGAARNTLLPRMTASAADTFDALRAMFHWPARTSCGAGSSYSSKLNVRRDYRNSTAALRLVSALYRRRFDDGVAFDYLLAPAALERLYARLGYVRCADLQDHPEAGTAVPMRLDLKDVERLRVLRSPFVRVSRSTPAWLAPTVSGSAL